jgi:hypothetical protein
MQQHRCLPQTVCQLTIITQFKTTISDDMSLLICRVLEKLVVTQSRNFPPFMEPRRFSTMFARARHWSLSCAIRIQSTPSHLVPLRYILILSSHIRARCSKWSLSLKLSDENFVCISHITSGVLHSPPYLSPWLDLVNSFSRRTLLYGIS